MLSEPRMDFYLLARTAFDRISLVWVLWIFKKIIESHFIYDKQYNNDDSKAALRLLGSVDILKAKEFVQGFPDIDKNITVLYSKHSAGGAGGGTRSKCTGMAPNIIPVPPPRIVCHDRLITTQFRCKVGRLLNKPQPPRHK